MIRVLRLALPVVLLLVLAAPVSAAPPEREPFEPANSVFASGEVCDFPLRVETIVMDAKTITFDRRDGAFRQVVNGRIVTRVTNLITDVSMTLNSSGPGVVTQNAAGHTVYRYGGSSVLTFFEGDVTGRGLLYFTGGGAEIEIGDDGFYFVRVVEPRHVVDLCAALTPH